ncbi:hypothetical protein ABH920_001838 [Catenulispora sp. EB89]|uniref:hypothetical protein n=1 Tax=Catenulispora sp. EB89 TaxID=3156257 RepID=UPI003510FC9F
MTASRSLGARLADHSGALHGTWGDAGAVAVGLLFLALGLVMALDVLRLLASKRADLSVHSAKWLHESTARLSSGRAEHHRQCKREGLLEVVGWGLVGLGAPAFLAGFVGLVA